MKSPAFAIFFRSSRFHGRVVTNSPSTSRWPWPRAEAQEAAAGLRVKLAARQSALEALERLERELEGYGAPRGVKVVEPEVEYMDNCEVTEVAC